MAPGSAAHPYWSINLAESRQVRMTARTDGIRHMVYVITRSLPNHWASKKSRQLK
jgi:hypothetical protein